MKKRVKVLLAGVGGGGYGVEIMKSLRLSTVPYFILGCDMSENSFGLYEADKGYVIPPAHSPDYLKVLLKICTNEQVQVLIPGSDHDLKRISKNRSIFIRQGIFIPINCPQVIGIGLDKMDTVDFLKRNDFLAPKTVLIDPIRKISAVRFMPAIVKPLTGSGSGNVFIAQDRAELKFFCQYLLKNGHKPMAQEYVGSTDDEYTVGILSDQEGKIMSATGIRRNILSGLSNRLRIQSRSKGGLLAVSSGISQGEVLRNPRIIEQCISIAKAIGSQGPLNIQCRLIKDKVCVFEINPRFSGTVFMRALTGVNEPDLMIRKYVFNEKTPKTLRSKKGRVLRGLVECFIPDLRSKKIINMVSK